MNKKRFKHIFICTVICALLFTLIAPICVFAADSDDYTSGEDANAAEENTPTANDAGAENEVSLFDSIFLAVKENLAQILSALAFIGSVAIILCYKKGFIPLVTEGLGAIACGVKTINEKTGELGTNTEQFSKSIDVRLKNAEELIKNSESIFKSLEENLNELNQSKREREITNEVLLAEVDMLYEIFMSAALPQYLKDSVGEKTSAMKAKLACEGKDEKN